MKKNFLKVVALAGLLVGTLDISAALIKFYSTTGKYPLIVLKYIASAIVGKEAAYSGGNKMAVLGLLLHFLVALIWTIFFFWIYPKLKLSSVNRILTGIAYGISIWAVMSYVILPMTKVTGGPFNLKQAAVDTLILIGAIGLPLSFIAYKYYKGERKR